MQLVFMVLCLPKLKCVAILASGGLRPPLVGLRPTPDGPSLASRNCTFIFSHKKFLYSVFRVFWPIFLSFLAYIPLYSYDVTMISKSFGKPNDSQHATAVNRWENECCDCGQAIDRPLFFGLKIYDYVKGHAQ